MQNSMHPNLTVRVGPQQYKCGEGVLDSLPQLLLSLKMKKILIVHGDVSWRKARKYLKNLYNSNLDIHEYLFAGECSQKAIEDLQTKITLADIDAIVAVGGGKIMDTVKYASYLANGTPFVAVPTLASNCAPWTPVSVIYNTDGSYDRLDILPLQATMLLIEPRLILDSPREYFIAGMADTLAKWYESDAILARNQKTPMLTMARLTAKECQTTILEKGEQALADLDAGLLSEAFVLVSEVIIAISGLVGGFGDVLARTTIAHEVHDALTVHPQVHQYLHGHVVGYGILVQLAVEGNWQEIATLQAFYRPLGIPVSLAEMGLAHLTEKELEAIAIRASLPELPVHLLPYPVTPLVIKEAIRQLEAL